MPRYEHVSGTVFALVAAGQLARAVLALPAQVGTYTVPIAASFVAFAVTASLAIWAFQTSRRSAR